MQPNIPDHHPPYSNKKLIKYKLIFPLVFVLTLLGGIRLISWDKVNWGKLEMLPGSAITVTGQAKEQISSQIAHFSAAVTITNDDKQTAVNEVNQKMTVIIQAVKDFGIDDQDIITQNVSVSEFKEPRPRGLQMPAVARWRASNSIAITLRDIDKASALTDLLSNLNATNISGPRFTVDDTQQAETDLMKAAVDNAREKAEAIAQASGRKLGKVLSVSEGATSRPGPILFRAEVGMDDEGVPIEPGSQTVSKTVTVIFELE